MNLYGYTGILSRSEKKLNPDEEIEEDLGVSSQSSSLLPSVAHHPLQGIISDVSRFGALETCYSLGCLFGFSEEMCDEEFKKLQQETKKIKIENFSAALFDNKLKNRYSDILPPDHTRVGLDMTRYPSEFYINANKICLHGEEYILTQGPLECTVKDFWTMVIREGCAVIVCATRQIENSRIKCFPYWRDFPNEEIDNYRIFSKDQDCDDERQQVIVKNIKLTSSQAAERKVAHVQITAWQDNKGLDSMLFSGILKEIYLQREKNSGALVIHCSAGVGRGGTIAAALSCLECIKKQVASGVKLADCKIDIFNTVLEGRRQRGVHFVMTKEQYRLLYKFFASRDFIQDFV